MQIWPAVTSGCDISFPKLSAPAKSIFLKFLDANITLLSLHTKHPNKVGKGMCLLSNFFIINVEFLKKNRWMKKHSLFFYFFY